MKLSSMKFISLLLPALLLLTPAALSFAAADCSFRTMVTTDDYSFNVSSQPGESCEKQQLTVSALRQAVPFSRFESPADTMVEKAWAEDIDDDGNVELLVLSYRFADPARKVLEIYAVDGTALKRVRLPETEQLPGYRGGDRFFMENGRIVRSYPLYLSTDNDGKPTGGEGRVLYQYRNKQVILVGGKENSRTAAATVFKEAAKNRNPKATRLKSIEVKLDYIEIKADGPIDNFKTTRIADPWRLIIDFPGAGSDIAGKEVTIDRHGISRVRIGTHKDHIRLVFDSAIHPLPTETVTQVENALRVGFYQPLKK